MCTGMIFGFTGAILLLGLGANVQGANDCSSTEIWCKRLQRCVVPGLECNCTCEHMTYFPSNGSCVNSSVVNHVESLCAQQQQETLWRSEIRLTLTELPQCKEEQALFTAIFQALEVERNQIRNTSWSCATEMLSFVMVTSNETVRNTTTAELSKRFSAGPVSVTYEGVIVSVTSVEINGVHIAIPVFALSTTKPTKKRYPLTINWAPILITIGSILSAVVLFICCSCCVHSYWLRKKKFTKFNSTPQSKVGNTAKREQRVRTPVPEVQENEGPSEFEMSSMEPPRVDERTLQHYDWVQTCYLPSMLGAPTDTLRTIPKLMCDDDSDPTEVCGRSNNGYSGDKIATKDREVEPNPLGASAAKESEGEEDFIDIDETTCDMLDDDYPKAPPTPRPPETTLDLKGAKVGKAGKAGKRRKGTHGQPKNVR